MSEEKIIQEVRLRNYIKWEIISLKNTKKNDLMIKKHKTSLHGFKLH